MNKQTLLITGLVSALAITGCTSNTVAEAPIQAVPVAPYAQATHPGQTPMVAQAPMAVHSQTAQPVTQVIHQEIHQSTVSTTPVGKTLQVVNQQGVGVQSHALQQAPMMAPRAPTPPKQPQSDLIKITGIGYGTASTYEGYTRGQKRLMAIRTSKLDAYRSLAEQLFGIKIDSNTSVSTLMAQNDNFRARVNAVVRGARVISITPLQDSNYETVLEVYIDENFFRNAFIYSGNSYGGNKPIDISEVCSSGMNCRSVH